MKTNNDILRDYSNYLDYMNANMGSRVFTFEEFVNYLLSEGKLTEEDFRKCYTFDGYLKEPKLKVDYD